jgi:hypothetical protein
LSFTRNFAFGGKKQKGKFLNWSVWEAQAKAIPSTSLEDTVLSHTASESTGLV